MFKDVVIWIELWNFAIAITHINVEELLLVRIFVFYLKTGAAGHILSYTTRVYLIELCFQAIKTKWELRFLNIGIPLIVFVFELVAFLNELLSYFWCSCLKYF